MLLSWEELRHTAAKMNYHAVQRRHCQLSERGRGQRERIRHELCVVMMPLIFAPFESRFLQESTLAEPRQISIIF